MHIDLSTTMFKLYHMTYHKLFSVLALLDTTNTIDGAGKMLKEAMPPRQHLSD